MIQKQYSFHTIDDPSADQIAEQGLDGWGVANILPYVSVTDNKRHYNYLFQREVIDLKILSADGPEREWKASSILPLLPMVCELVMRNYGLTEFGAIQAIIQGLAGMPQNLSSIGIEVRANYVQATALRYNIGEMWSKDNISSKTVKLTAEESMLCRFLVIRDYLSGEVLKTLVDLNKDKNE